MSPSKPLKFLILNETVSAVENNSEQLFDRQDILQMFHISVRTLQYWRTKGLLAYSKIGKKIFYRQSDVEQMLLQNKVTLTVSSFSHHFEN